MFSRISHKQSEQDESPKLKSRFSDSYLIWMLAQFIFPYWVQMLIVFVMLLIATGLTLLPPYLVQLAVDGPLANGDTQQLMLLAGIYFVTIPSIFVFQFGYVYLLQTVGQNALVDLRQRMFDHILKQDMRYFNQTPVGQIVSRMSNDIEALTELFSTSIVMVASNLVLLIGLVGTMLVLNWRLALISLAVLPIMSAMTMYFRVEIRNSSSTLHKLVAQYQAFVNEQFNGMMIVQLFGRQELSRQEFDEINTGYRNVHMEMRDQYTYFMSGLQFLTAVGLGLVLYGGAKGIISEWASLGMVIAFIQYTRRSFVPILLLSDQFSQIQTALSAGERIARMLQVEPEIHDPREVQTLPAKPKDITFNDVYFHYVEDAPVIRGIDLYIPAGQTVAIVGATGAGKTSLAGLLTRFHDVVDGAILINGVDIRDVRLSELRNNVVVVPQSPYCFHGTIAENLCLFDKSISERDMRDAAETASAAPFIERLPGEYDFQLQPGGSNLSQGQRQLLALARALLHSPNSILVLDEATSNIDTETEALIQEGLRRVLKNRTSIVIAHRLSTVRDADRILVMKQGKIVEDGNHEALLEQDGLYAGLYKSQFAEAHIAI